MSLKRLRVDNVGSMLRPPELRQAFAARASGEIDEDTLTRVEDDAIRELVARQETLGLPVIVDGEFRRSGYLASFSEIEGADRWLRNWTPRAVGRENPVEAGVVRGRDPTHDDSLRSPATARLRLRRIRERRAAWSASATGGCDHNFGLPYPGTPPPRFAAGLRKAWTCIRPATIALAEQPGTDRR